MKMSEVDVVVDQRKEKIAMSITHKETGIKVKGHCYDQNIDFMQLQLMRKLQREVELDRWGI